MYIAALRGYIVDVPLLFFKRCDGKKYVFDKLSNFSSDVDFGSLTVNAGWSKYAVCTIPGQNTMNFNVTVAQFDSELWAMANAQNFEVAEKKTIIAWYEAAPDAETHQIVLPSTPLDGSVFVPNMVAGDAPADGVYTVSEGTLTFDPSVVDGVRVSYETEVENVPTVLIDNSASAIGEVYAVFPVYNDGTNCTDSGITHYLVLHMFRGRITQVPTLSGSYKSPSTFDFTVSTEDPHRLDDAAYELFYMTRQQFREAYGQG